jgi:hypothetical protein
MISVEIPKKDIPNFQKLIDLDEDKFSELILLLERLPVELKPANLHDTLKESSIEAGEKLTSIILSVTLTNVKEEVDRSDFIKGLYASFIENDGQSDEDVFINRLTEIASAAQPLSIAFKVAKSKKELGHYVDKHTLSVNINPLFDDKNTLYGNLIMYTLNVGFEDGDTSILSFDRENLLKLKQAIENIELQSENLIDIFSKSNINIIE